jgi:uncharacterized protein
MSSLTPAPEPGRGRATPLPNPAPWALTWAVPANLALLLFVDWDSLVQNLVLFAGGLAVYVILVRYCEHRPVREVRGGPTSAGQAGLGLAVGVAIFTFGPLAMLATGIFSFHGFTPWRAFSVSFGGVLMLIAGVVYEELFNRGIILRYLELWLGSSPALGISALVFAVSHFVGGSQRPEDFVLRAAMGVLLGAAYLLTRRLWLSIGIHLGLNLGLGLMFGYLGVPTPLLVFETRKGLFWLDPIWHTVAVLAVAGILLWLARRKGLIVKPKDAWRAQIGAAPSPPPIPSLPTTCTRTAPSAPQCTVSSFSENDRSE